MNHRSVTRHIAAPAEAVVQYLADPENLPAWATEFCQSVRKEGPHTIVDTRSGPLHLVIRSDSDLGVVDFFVGPTPQQLGVLPTRIVALPAGGSLVSFLLLQAPDVDDASFADQAQGLEIEVQQLKSLLEDSLA